MRSMCEIGCAGYIRATFGTEVKAGAEGTKGAEAVVSSRATYLGLGLGLGSRAHLVIGFGLGSG